MRFWITKNSEVPIREQLFRQVRLAILSEDLPAGHKLQQTAEYPCACPASSHSLQYRERSLP